MKLKKGQVVKQIEHLAEDQIPICKIVGIEYDEKEDLVSIYHKHLEESDISCIKVGIEYVDKIFIPIPYKIKNGDCIMDKRTGDIGTVTKIKNDLVWAKWPKHNNMEFYIYDDDMELLYKKKSKILKFAEDLKKYIKKYGGEI